MSAPETSPSSRPSSRDGTAAPFATRSVGAFYASLLRRYARPLAAMAALLGVFAVLSGVRLLALGLVVDVVEAHATDDPPAEGGTGAPLPGGPRRGEIVQRFESVWMALAPPSRPPPTREIHSVDGLLRFLFVIVGGGLGAVSVLLGLVYFFKEYFANEMVAGMLVDVRGTLFDHLTTQPVSYFNDRRSGDLISRVTNDVETLQGALQHFFQTFLQQPPVILAGIWVACVASPFLFALSVPLLAVLMIPVFRAGKRVLHHGRKRQDRLGIITEALQQLFSGVRIVKAFGMEPHEREAFAVKNREFGRSFFKMLQAKVTGRSLQEVLFNLGFTGLLLLGGYFTATGELSAGTLSAYALAMVQIYTPLKTASKAWNKIQEASAGIERVLEVLREEPAMRDAPDAREFPGLRQTITFDHVGFDYREIPGITLPPDAAKLPALTDFHLEVEKGQVVALVGPSGAGKSTVVDLLARFYDCQQGAIRVDGVDIREYRHSSYLESIAIVSQDPFLFNTTIRENIRYGLAGATDAMVEEAARAASAHEFILAQPEGYDTSIGDRGAKLSGGQRQRLTIARALLKNAPILILDEATSALDSEAEREVRNAIETLVQDRTTFVIAHRLSTIVRADKIVVLQAGRIVECGRHEELLAREGRYWELVSAQAHPPAEGSAAPAPPSRDADARALRA